MSGSLTDFLATLAAKEIQLWVEEGTRLRFRGPKGALTPELAEELKARKEEILASFAATTAAAAPVPRQPDADTYALSQAQWRLWVLMQMEQTATAYNVPLHLELKGTLDRSALENAFNRLVQRHEILRTRFVQLDGEARQKVLREFTLTIPFEDLSGEAHPIGVARERGRQHAAQSFDLERDALLRVTLLRLSEKHHVVLLTLHHIIADGTSFGILLREFAQLYQAQVEGRADPLTPLALQYRDFAAWQNALLQSPAMAPHRNYWHQKLGGELPVLNLPLDFPRPPAQTFRGKEWSFALDRSRLDALLALAQQHHATLFMVLMAAVKTLLFRHTGQTDLIVGSPIAGRVHPDLEQQIGFYLNTLALRDQIDPAKPFAALLDGVRQTTTEAFDHQLYPFDFLVNELAVRRDLSRAPLVDALVVLQNQDERGHPIAGLELSSFLGASETSKLDLTFYFKALDDRLQGAIEYNPDLFAEERIERMAAQFAVLIDGIIATPATPLARLPMLPVAERERALVEFNATAAPIEADRTTVDLIEAQVERTPDAVALTFGETAITYRELNARANQLAERLRSRGAKPETLVAVCLERSLDLVVALLAVLKTGAAYVPLDPGFPAERLSYMIEDSGTTLLIAEPEQLATLAMNGVVRVAPSAERENLTKLSEANAAASRAHADSLAYVIYTSGSTGKPKGVQVLHRGLTNFLQSMQREPGLTSADTLLAVTTVSFDIAGLELWLPLITGAKIVLSDRATAIDGEALLALLRSSGATVMQATPATWRLLLAAGWESTAALRAFCGGEALPSDLAAELLQRSGEVWNLYGPTETTIWSTLQRVTPDALGAAAVSIGRPIANTQAYVLDAAGQPAPIGVAGELHLGGEGLARGYWRRPELTAEKFIPDPFSGAPRARLYRTGDLARWRDDGTIEYLGRIDHQVKLRGYRIELGEIEAALTQHSLVENAAVVLREDTPGDAQLVAYVVARGAAPDLTVWREFLRERLPDYMVPTAWVVLPALPLTANGKVDRRALPAPEASARVAASILPPRNATETSIAEIWAAVLGVTAVGVDQNFFELGGHSLKATMVVARLRRTLQVDVSIADLFRQPTVAGLAEIIASRSPHARATEQMETVPGRVEEAAAGEILVAAAAAAQRRLWIIDRMMPGLPVYNMSEALELRGELNVAALRRALTALVARHETLRTTFQIREGEPRQVIVPPADFPLQEIDLSEAPNSCEAVQAIASAEALAPFDLERGPLFRAKLVRVADGRHLLLCSIHHIVSDAWSMMVLSRELGSLYRAFSSGAVSPLPPLPAQYREFARQQNEELSGSRGTLHRDYWLRQFAGERTPLALPTDFPRPAVQTAAGKTHVFKLGRELSQALKRVGHAQGATPFMTLLALVKTLLARYTGQEDIVVGSPVAGRDREEWEGLIGFFVNTLPLRDTVRANETFAELLVRVRQTCVDAFEHQRYPFDRLVDDLKLERDLSRSPLFDVSMQLLNVERSDVTIAGLTFAEYNHGQSPAKCDLNFDFTETPDGFTCALTYHADLFAAPRIERIGAHLRQLAASLVAKPDAKLGAFELLTVDEKSHVLAIGSPRRERLIETVPTWFDRVAEQQPDHPALRFEAETLSFAELRARANRLANFLRRRGVARQSVVGVMLERSLALPTSVLAVMKAGAIYLPLDPMLPAARLAHMAAESGARFVITSRGLASQVPAGLERIVLEEVAAEIDAESAAASAGGPTERDGAYLIFTSGSTGTPKGVLVEHAGFVNTTADHVERLALSPADRVLQFASLSFDASVSEMFKTLLAGATLVLARRETLTDPAAFLACLKTQGVTLAVLPPSFLRSLERAELPLRILFTAGEAAVVEDARHYATRLTYVNGYGPTEASVCSTMHVVKADDAMGFGVPIGTPVPNTTAYVLDVRGQLVPVGVPGELWVGGAGVARGYWQRPDLTAERFTPDPFSGSAGARMYRTGDICRWREDGALEFFGRTDAQIKLRGYRIELGEVTAAVQRCSGVREALVMLREDRPGQRLLVAYFVPAASEVPADQALLAELRRTLPEYMLPSVFVTLPAFPLSAAGKIDRRALPVPNLAAAENEYVAPRDEVEQALAGVMRDVLKLERIGAHDRFFQIGGNSLAAIQVISRVRDVFKVEVPVPRFFENASVAGLAALLRADEATKQQVERTARALAKLAALSPEEKQRLLAQKRMAAAKAAT